MSILITGGSGFIGSHLIDKLVKTNNIVKNYDTVSPKHSFGNLWVEGDIRDLSKLEKVVQDTNISIIYNLAGMLGTHELVDNAIEATKVNIIGTLNILEMCKKHKIKLVEVSKPNCWVNTYTITKVAAESFVEMYRREFDVKAVVIKWFNVYGPRQPLFKESGYTKFIPTAIVSALKNEDIIVYGNGNQTMDLVHTADTIDATLAIVTNWERCEGKTFDVGNSVITVNQCAELIKKLTKSRSKIVNVPMRKGETENTEICANLNLLQNLTKYKMKIPLIKGLKDTIIWYKTNYNL